MVIVRNIRFRSVCQRDQSKEYFSSIILCNWNFGENLELNYNIVFYFYKYKSHSFFNSIIILLLLTVILLLLTVNKI